MKKLYFIALLSLMLGNARSQTFAWAKLEGLYAYDYGMGIAKDNSGNVYVTGKYEMNAVFSGNTITCAGNHDIFTAKYTPTGALSWIRTGGGPNGDYAHCVAFDNNGGIAISGEIEAGGLSTFPGSTITLNGVGDNDIMTAKYDLNGNLLWARSAGGYGSEKTEGMACDAAGNVYIAGHFKDPCPIGTQTLIGAGMGSNLPRCE